MDTEEIKAAFDELYQRMHGMSLQEMDRIVDAVCALCRDHQRSGFADGIKVGLRRFDLRCDIMLIRDRFFLILLHKCEKSELWLSLKSKNRIDKARGMEL